MHNSAALPNRRNALAWYERCAQTADLATIATTEVRLPWGLLGAKLGLFAGLLYLAWHHEWTSRMQPYLPGDLVWQLLCALPMAWLVMRLLAVVSGGSWSGLDRMQWRSHLGEALLLSVPLLLLLVIAKAALLLSSPASSTLFQPDALFEQFNWSRYGWAWLGTATLCLLVEYVRYGSLRLLQRHFGERGWGGLAAGLFANLLCAVPYLSFGWEWMLLSLLPGALWAWLSAHQRSVLGAAASHLLLAGWATLLLGMPMPV